MVGGEVWLDNITVDHIEGFSYTSLVPSSEIVYHKDQMITDWIVLGPFNKRVDEVEESANTHPIVFDKQEYDWSESFADARGCVLAGKICRYSSDQKFAYFSTKIQSKNEVQTEIQFSSLNNLLIWVNSKYVGAIEKQRHAWFDFFQDPDHAGNSLQIRLNKGTNRILVLVEGANYSGDGFYSYIIQ